MVHEVVMVRVLVLEVEEKGPRLPLHSAEE